MAATEEAVGRSFDDETDADTAPNAPALMQEPLPGTGSQLSLLAGGDEPETAEVKLRGGSLPVEGQYEKGEVVNLMIKVRIAEVHFVDVIDKYGNVTSTVRRHVGKMQGVQRQQ
jgi:hypothetical protein